MHFIFYFQQQTFPNLYELLNLDDLTLWSSFARSSHCELDFPVQLHQKLSPFQQLLIIQAARPDRLESAMVNFTSRALGMHVSYFSVMVYLTGIAYFCSLISIPFVTVLFWSLEQSKNATNGRVRIMG